MLVAITFLPAVTSPFADASHNIATVFVLLSIVLVPLQSLPLWWRRSHPVAVWWTVVAVVATKLLFGLSINASVGAVVLAVYAISVYGPSPQRLWAAAVFIALIVAGIVTFYFGLRNFAGDLLGFGPPMVIAWVVGDYVRSRRERVAEVMARHEAARERAVEAERLRIARELHDVVAHKVSLLAIQAGAARMTGKADGQTLTAIEQGARDTLAELNKLLGVLRKSPDGPELGPQPTLDDVAGLVAAARQAGLEANLNVIGDRRMLPPAVELSAYRIVQEAVTNVLKHAHATRIEVGIDYGVDALRVSVSDNGLGQHAAASNGHGLVGMRERVELFGGELVAGTSPLGGFKVRATLPLAP